MSESYLKLQTAQTRQGTLYNALAYAGEISKNSKKMALSPALLRPSNSMLKFKATKK